MLNSLVWTAVAALEGVIRCRSSFDTVAADLVDDANELSAKLSRNGLEKTNDEGHNSAEMQAASMKKLF